MVRRWEDLTYRQRKIVMGLAKSTRSSVPMIVAWLNEQDEQGSLWDNIDTLAELFEKQWKH